MLSDKFRGAVFDFDGTLADSLHVWSDIDEKFMAKRGLSVPKDYFMSVASMDLSEAAVYTIELLGLNESPEAVMQEWCGMAQYEYEHNVFLKAGAKEFVSFLRENGIKTAIATASAESFFLSALKNNNADALFDAYATTAEVGRGKGFPDVYDLAAKRIGCAPGECLVFEDIAAGIKGAKDGGYIAVGVYDSRSAGDEREIKRLADMYAEDYFQLKEKFSSVMKCK